MLKYQCHYVIVERFAIISKYKLQLHVKNIQIYYTILCIIWSLEGAHHDYTQGFKVLCCICEETNGINA